MPLRYGYAKATLTSVPQLTPTPRKNETQYHLRFGLDVSGAPWDIAMNVGTNNGRDLLRYKLLSPFVHPITDLLRQSPAGAQELTGTHALPALDFDRGDILTGTGDWRNSDVMNGTSPSEPATSLQSLLTTAKENGHTVYVFGRFYTSGGDGIHDTHMNQGSTGAYLNPADPDSSVQAQLNHVHPSPDHNDIWQDGALLIDTGTDWTAYFAAFAQQFLPTDDYGNPTSDARPVGE